MFRRMSILRSLLVALVCLAASVLESVSEPDWNMLESRNEDVSIEGQTVTLTLLPSLKSSVTTGPAVRLDLRLDVGLSDLQRKIPAILAHWADRKSRKCGLSWSFPRITPPGYASGRLWVKGTVRVAQGVCAFGTKTRLWRETAGFRIALSPAAVGNRVRLVATLEQLNPGKGVPGQAGVEKEIEAAVEAVVRAVVYDETSVDFPKALKELDPRLMSATFRESGNGAAILRVEAQADISPSDLARLMKLLLAP